MQGTDLSGIWPPIPTPFRNTAVAYDALQANVERWCQTGVAGLVVLGSNGEYVYLSEDEKRRVIKAVVEAVPKGFPVIVGTGCESTRETLKLSEDAAHLGAKAALVVTPHYYGGRMTSAALIQYYADVADKAPLPLLLYNVPKFTHVTLASEAVDVLSAHANIIGIKDSAGNAILLGEYLRSAGEGFQVLVGTAGALFSGLTLGCVGGILALANIAPQACLEIFTCIQAGDWDKAREVQQRMLPVNKAVTATYGIGGLKAALDMLGYFGGEVRAPLMPLGRDETSALRTILIEGGLIE